MYEFVFFIRIADARKMVYNANTLHPGDPPESTGMWNFLPNPGL